MPIQRRDVNDEYEGLPFEDEQPMLQPRPYRSVTDPTPFPPDPAFQSPGMGGANVFILGALLCCIITVLSVLIIILVRPENKDGITTIIGIMTPITMALLSAGIYGVHKGVNGRFSQLLYSTADEAERAGRAKILQRMYYRLQALDPDSEEYHALAKQLRMESIQHFNAVDQRNSKTTSTPGVERRHPQSK